MEKLPPCLTRVVKPKSHEITSDPLIRAALAFHYDTEDKEVYKAAFQEEQEEILNFLYEMGFKEIKNEIENFNSESNAATNTASAPIATTIIISPVESSGTRENIDPVTE
jgi:hypothetical protein